MSMGRLAPLLLRDRKRCLLFFVVEAHMAEERERSPPRVSLCIVVFFRVSIENERGEGG